MTMVMASMARVMATSTRVAGEQQQGQWLQQQLWQATMRGNLMAMRVVSNKEGEGRKLMATVTELRSSRRAYRGLV
jgi:hypothetical protein